MGISFISRLKLKKEVLHGYFNDKQLQEWLLELCAKQASALCNQAMEAAKGASTTNVIGNFETELGEHLPLKISVTVGESDDDDE